jgi:hypothetical protein
MVVQDGMMKPLGVPPVTAAPPVALAPSGSPSRSCGVSPSIVVDGDGRGRRRGEKEREVVVKK